MSMTVEMRPVTSIKVTDRVRDSFGDLRELIDSMRDRGQINPITIQPDGTLIAGERRLRAARELGWDVIACHVWEEKSAEELIAVEIEENTARAQLTLVEAERAWQKYRELLRPAVKHGSDRVGQEANEPEIVLFPDDDKGGSQGASGPGSHLLPDDNQNGSGSRLNQMAAELTGYGRPTMERVEEIRKTAEDETEPESVRLAAKQEYAKLKTATRGATPALERIRLAKRQATREAMRPGQWLKSDEPRAPAKPVNWHTRLWDVVGTGKAIRKTAEELEAAPDTTALSVEDIDKMRKLLQEQAEDRRHLRSVLLNIKEGRKK
jgi:ParB family transcriptional regulator, chromosome partitioning protein